MKCRALQRGTPVAPSRFVITEQARCKRTPRLLLVEPELPAALLVLEAIRDAGEPLELCAVFTCDGALDALRLQPFDGILLSINLCCRDAEYDVLPSLSRRAELHAIPLLALCPPGFGSCATLLGVPLCASLSHEDVRQGKLGEALSGRKPREQTRGCGESECFG